MFQFLTVDLQSCDTMSAMGYLVGMLGNHEETIMQ